MSVEWTEAKIYKLVLSYMRHECLWKIDSDCYNNLEARKNAYFSIIRDVNIRDLTIGEVRDKIRQIRRSYRFELAKINDANFRGFPYKPNITWFELMHAFLCAYITDDEDKKIDNLSHTNAEEEKYSNYRCNIPLQSLRSSFQHRCSIEDRPNGIRYLPIQSSHVDTCPNKLIKNKTSSSSHGKLIGSAAFRNDATVSYPNFSLTQQQQQHIASIADTGAAAVQKTCKNIGPKLTSTVGDYSSIRDDNRNDRDVIVNEALQTVTNSNGKKKSSKLQKKDGDEFDVFGKSIACQLRELSLPNALRTQAKIQSLLAEERIDLNKEKEANYKDPCKKRNSHRRKNFHGDSRAPQSSKSSDSSVNYHSNIQCPSASDFSSSAGIPISNRSRQNNRDQINKTDTFRLINGSKKHNKKC